MFKEGFSNEQYLKLQSQKIKERISLFGERLYLEFGGKLFDDFHASRVLPGFEPDSKIRMLIELKDEAEIIILTRKFETSHVGGATGRTPPIPRSALEKDPRPGTPLRRQPCG